MPQRNDLSLRQLEYVVALADTLGFRRAAERTHVSQPALSAQLKQLESVLGVVLFERDPRRVLATEAGSALIARARVVLRAVDDLLAEAERQRDEESGTLRTGVIPTIAPYLLPEAMPTLRARFPRVRWTFREEKTDTVVSLLERGELDLGLVAKGTELDGFSTIDVLRDPFVLATAKEHPLAARESVRLADLDDELVLLLDEGHCFRAQALAVCGRAGARESELRATSLPTLVQMVASGLGVTLLPTLSVAAENRSGALAIIPFRDPVPCRTITLAFRQTTPRAHLIEQIAATIARAHDAAASPVVPRESRRAPKKRAK
jgi:LysR family hydrogen peroxide-inducible transcriptional activator